MNKNGFTFIEVLVAMLILVLAVLASVSLTDGSVRATREAKDISTATWLLQNVMTELETKLETEGIEKGCEAKKEAKFEAPYEKYSWTTTCIEIDFNLSQTAADLAKQNEEDDVSQNREQENQIQKFILDTASQYITKSLRELHAEVSWSQGKQRRKVDATTHFARYDQPIALPNLGGAGGGTGGSGSGGGGG